MTNKIVLNPTIQKFKPVPTHEFRKMTVLVALNHTDGTYQNPNEWDWDSLVFPFPAILTRAEVIEEDEFKMSHPTFRPEEQKMECSTCLDRHYVTLELDETTRAALDDKYENIDLAYLLRECPNCDSVYNKNNAFADANDAGWQCLRAQITSTIGTLIEMFACTAKLGTHIVVSSNNAHTSIAERLDRTR